MRALLLLGMVLVVGGCGTTSVDRLPSNGPQRAGGDVYIPKDLDDSLAQLNKLFTADDIRRIKAAPEADMFEYQLGWGTWLRNDWGLWNGSRLAQWFEAQGVHHPDDMSSIILDSYWRRVHARPVRLEDQVKYYQDVWRKAEEVQKKNAHPTATPSAPEATVDPS